MSESESHLAIFIWWKKFPQCIKWPIYHLLVPLTHNKPAGVDNAIINHIYSSGVGQRGRRATSGAPRPALRAQEAGAHTGVRRLPHRPVLDLSLESGDPPLLLVCPSPRSPTASSPGSLPHRHCQAAAGQGQATCPKDPGPEPVAAEPAPAGWPGGAGTSSQPSALGMPASAVSDSAGGRGTGVCT